jgi:hypothetical protein
MNIRETVARIRDRDRVDDFIEGFVAPILVGNFGQARAYLQRTPQERYFAASDRSGLSLALVPHRYRPKDTAEEILRCARHRIATLELLEARGIPVEVYGEDDVLDRKGQITEKALDKATDGMSTEALFGWYHGHDAL